MNPDSIFARETIASLIAIPHGGSLVDWADGKLMIPYSVRFPVFIASESAWLLEPMRAISDPKISRVDVRMPAGAAKSLIGESLIAWCVDQFPGMIYYVWQTDDDAKDAMEDRIYPMLEANKILSNRLPTDRSKKRNAKIAFPHMTLYAVGANESAAQSKRVKILIMEEPHLYEPGMMKAFEDRTAGVKHPKILTLSTGSVLGDDSDITYCAGSCEEWQVACPHCGEYQTMTDARDRLVAQIDAETCDENGEYVWSKILPTVRYNCEKCGKDWPTDAPFRKYQSQTGHYQVTNLNAPEDHRSFHCEATAIHYEKFELSTLFMLKMQAVMAYKQGAIEPFRNYIQKQRALAWDERPTDTDVKAAWDRSKGEYLRKEPHEFEITRFLTVDNQAGKASKGQGAHRWYVCRSFSVGECRLIDEGRVTSWEEVEEKRIELQVEPGRTLVDIGFDTAAVQAVCVRYGWQGLWGDSTGKRSYPHHDLVMTPQGQQRVVRHYPFSTPQIGHVGIGKEGVNRQARYFFWCQTPIKDMWHRLKNGMTTYRWTVPQDVSDAYREQTNVEFKKQQTEKKTGKKSWVWCVQSKKDNHLTDCDQMILVASLMDKQLRAILWGAGEGAIIENEQQKSNHENNRKV